VDAAGLVLADDGGVAEAGGHAIVLGLQKITP
jgi:hypothetical protein